VVLAKCVAHRVHLSLPRPDQALVGTCQDLDGLRKLGVTGDHAVVQPVRAHEVGERLGVAGVGLRARAHVALAVARQSQGVDRVEAVAGRDERLDEQAPIGLDADDHLVSIRRVRRERSMQSRHPREAVRDALPHQDRSCVVDDTDVVVGLGPVDPHVDHAPSFRLG